MTDILENSLVMAVLTACILIPVFIVKKINRKKKEELLLNTIGKISLDNNLKLVRTDTVGNLLIALSENQQLLLLNIVDFKHEIINLEKVNNVQESIAYNGKEVKSILLRLSFNTGANREIILYKQYDSSERELSGAKKLAKE